MSREDEIKEAVQEYRKKNFQNDLQAFRDGIQWADETRAEFFECLNCGEKMCDADTMNLYREIDSFKNKLAIAVEALEDIRRAASQRVDTSTEIECHNLADEALSRINGKGE